MSAITSSPGRCTSPSVWSASFLFPRCGLCGRNCSLWRKSCCWESAGCAPITTGWDRANEGMSFGTVPVCSSPFEEVWAGEALDGWLRKACTSFSSDCRYLQLIISKNIRLNELPSIILFSALSPKGLVNYTILASASASAAALCEGIFGITFQLQLLLEFLSDS